MRVHRLALLRIDAGRIGADQLDPLQRQPFDRLGCDRQPVAAPFVVRETVPGAEQHAVGAVDMRQVGNVDRAVHAARVDHQAGTDIGIDFHAGGIQRALRIMQRSIGMGARMRAHRHPADIDGRAFVNPPCPLEPELGVARPDGQVRAQGLRNVPDAAGAFPAAHIAVRTLSSSGKKAAFSTLAR